MAPDLNSLPPSRSSSTSSSFPRRNIAATSPGAGPAPVNPNATVASSPLPSRGSSMGRLSVSERRRSAAPNQIELPGTGSGMNGETTGLGRRASLGHAFRTASPTSHGGSPIFATADPHHQRAPSLGELHQELEQEQEAQVNRLLQMIRSQQAQLQQLQQQNGNQQQNHQSATAIIDDTTPASEQSSSVFRPIITQATIPSSRLSISSLSNRRSSRPASQTASPSLQPQATDSMEVFPALREGLSRRASRDESAFYQTEAVMLTRENQMLRQRVRELERRIAHLTASSTLNTVSGEESGQEGPETAGPRFVQSTDGK